MTLGPSDRPTKDAPLGTAQEEGGELAEVSTTSSSHREDALESLRAPRPPRPNGLENAPDPIAKVEQMMTDLTERMGRLEETVAQLAKTQQTGGAQPGTDTVVFNAGEYALERHERGEVTIPSECPDFDHNTLRKGALHDAVDTLLSTVFNGERGYVTLKGVKEE